MTDSPDTILIADDDEDIVRFVEVNLRLEGFEVATAFDGEQALHAAYDIDPDLILLDVMMPKVDGFEVCQRLRSDGRTKNISIIMLTAKSLSADKVVGLTAGADDYMIKPFDPIELVARVKSALRRSKEMRAINPLTQLPGNVQIQEEVTRKVQAGTPFAVMYIDIDDFKAFNDYYGFLRGDAAIKLLARCATDSVNEHGGPDPFLGHIGGDDLVAIVDAESAEKTATALLECWDREAPSLYDPADVENGYIDVVDRQKQMHRYKLASVSIGIASNVNRQISSHWEASEIASEMKQFAKRQEGSVFAMDRRTREARAAAEGTPPPPA
ncbi:MAG TPA: response regulator [Actinomycetota bacterium]|nr:response regulator [Actinomycetota bacterium]